MKIKPHSQFGLFTLRALVGLSLCMAGLALAVFAFEQPAERARQAESPPRDLPTLGANPQEETSDLGRLEQYWSDRLTYPTGNFDPTWVRQAADQDALISRSVPAGLFPTTKGNI